MLSEVRELAQLGGTVITVILFLYYLNKKDELSKKTYDEFNMTINNHLDHSTKVIKDNSDALTQISVNLKELSLVIKNSKKKR